MTGLGGRSRKGWKPSRRLSETTEPQSPCVFHIAFLTAEVTEQEAACKPRLRIFTHSTPRYRRAMGAVHTLPQFLAGACTCYRRSDHDDAGAGVWGDGGFPGSLPCLHGTVVILLPLRIGMVSIGGDACTSAPGTAAAVAEADDSEAGTGDVRDDRGDAPTGFTGHGGRAGSRAKHVAGDAERSEGASAARSARENDGAATPPLGIDAGHAAAGATTRPVEAVRATRRSAAPGCRGCAPCRRGSR